MEEVTPTVSVTAAPAGVLGNTRTTRVKLAGGAGGQRGDPRRPSMGISNAGPEIWASET